MGFTLTSLLTLSFRIGRKNPLYDQISDTSPVFWPQKQQHSESIELHLTYIQQNILQGYITKLHSSLHKQSILGSFYFYIAISQKQT